MSIDGIFKLNEEVDAIYIELLDEELMALVAPKCKFKEEANGNEMKELEVEFSI